MKILLATWTLNGMEGASLFALELASSLSSRGHEVIVYVRNRIKPLKTSRAATPQIVHDLQTLPFVPDIVHCQTQPVLLEVVAQLPGVPIVYVVHAADDAMEYPLAHRQVSFYVGVDERCRREIARNPSIPPARIGTILNSVDLDRFRPRGALPARPARAAVFSNLAHRSTHLLPVLQACRDHSLLVDTIGRGAGTFTERPELLLPQYDVVFAKARCAIEAMAVGNAVVLCDAVGLGEMVRQTNFEKLRLWNFGAGVMTRPLEPALIAEEIAKYDAEDAASVSARIRASAGLDHATEQWIDLYRRAIATQPWPLPLADGQGAAGTASTRKWKIVYRLWAFRGLVRWVEHIPVLGLPLFHFARGLWYRFLHGRFGGSRG